MVLHDPKLDVGAGTFEEALIKLAEKVRTHYGSASQYDEPVDPVPISPDLAAFFAELDTIGSDEPVSEPPAG